MKLKLKTGETLAETLVSLIIISLALLMLPGAVVAASRVNAEKEKQVIFMEKYEGDYGTSEGTFDVTFTLGGDNSKASVIKDVEVTRFGSEENGLYGAGMTVH